MRSSEERETGAAENYFVKLIRVELSSGSQQQINVVNRNFAEFYQKNVKKLRVEEGEEALINNDIITESRVHKNQSTLK